MWGKLFFFSPPDVLCTSTLKPTQVVDICRRHKKLKPLPSQNIGSISRITRDIIFQEPLSQNIGSISGISLTVADQPIVGTKKQIHAMINMISENDSTFRISLMIHIERHLIYFKT